MASQSRLIQLNKKRCAYRKCSYSVPVCIRDRDRSSQKRSHPAISPTGATRSQLSEPKTIDCCRLNDLEFQSPKRHGQSATGNDDQFSWVSCLSTLPSLHKPLLAGLEGGGILGDLEHLVILPSDQEFQEAIESVCKH